MEDEEYELVALSPVRRLEKRVDAVEKKSLSQETMKEVLEIIRSNQEIVEDIVKVNSEMISRVSDLARGVDVLMAKVNDFMSRIEIAAGEEQEKKTEETAKAPEIGKEAGERISKLEKRLNALIMSNLTKQKMIRRV